METPKSFLDEHKDFVLKLRLVGIGGTPQIRRVRLPRVAVEGSLSYDALVGVAIGYTFPDAPLVPDDYDVTFTYYDVDNDCVTIASTEELTDAIGQFTDVLRITTDVKRKKNRPIPTTPPRVSRATEAPGTPPSPPSNRTAQLQSILETFVSILATALVALQSHVNPAPPVTNPVDTATVEARSSDTATGEARVAMDAPTTPEADLQAARDLHLKKKKDIKNLKKELHKLKREAKSVNEDAPAPDEKPAAVDRPFIHGRHTCDRCLCTPIVGKRFHATNLPDYDLCEKCKDGYKGTEIQFEAVELDRDRPFQERWHRKRARFEAAGHCGSHGGPRVAKRSPYCGPRGRRSVSGRNHPEPMDAMDAALKEAIRRSLQDVSRAPEPEPTAPVEEAPKQEAPVDETEPAPEETKPASSIDEAEAAAPAAFEVNIEEPTSNTSFSLDAIGNGIVAEVLGQTLDQFSDAINAMVTEINRDSFNSTRDTATSTDAEEGQMDDESTGVISVDGSIEEEAEIAVEAVTEDDDDASNAPDFVAEATDDSPMAGATILEPIDVEGVTCEEDSVKSERSEDEWEVVKDDEEQVADDEMLARAASVIGSSLFESDMERSNFSTLTGGADSSVLSSVPTINSVSVSVPAVLLDRWAPQLTQLRELGFVDDAQSVDVLERLNAANIGVDSDDEITVERVVNVLLKND